MSELFKNIREILAAPGSGYVHVASYSEGCEWSTRQNEYPLLKKFKSEYGNVVDFIRKERGEPSYEGSGVMVSGRIDPHGVIQDHPYAGPDLSLYFSTFARSLELTCWAQRDKMVAVTVSSHDGGSLMILQVEAADRNRGTGA